MVPLCHEILSVLFRYFRGLWLASYDEFTKCEPVIYQALAHLRFEPLLTDTSRVTIYFPFAIDMLLQAPPGILCLLVKVFGGIHLLAESVDVSMKDIFILTDQCAVAIDLYKPFLRCGSPD